MKLVEHVLWYVSRILNVSLKFDGEADIQDNVVKYTHSKFAGSKTNWKSIGSNIFMLVGVVISYLSKL